MERNNTVRDGRNKDPLILIRQSAGQADANLIDIGGHRDVGGDGSAVCSCVHVCMQPKNVILPVPDLYLTIPSGEMRALEVALPRLRPGTSTAGNLHTIETCTPFHTVTTTVGLGNRHAVFAYDISF